LKEYPTKQRKTIGLDQQIVIIYELRNLPEYFSFTKRFLEDKMTEWENKKKEVKYQRLIEESRETIKYSEKWILLRFLIRAKNRLLGN